MRILTLEEMELVAGGGGSRPKKAKRAPNRRGSHSGGSNSCSSGSHSGQGSSSGAGCGAPPPI